MFTCLVCFKYAWECQTCRFRKYAMNQPVFETTFDHLFDITSWYIYYTNNKENSEYSEGLISIL